MLVGSFRPDMIYFHSCYSWKLVRKVKEQNKRTPNAILSQVKAYSAYRKPREAYK